MKQIVDNDQAMHLIKLDIEARTIGELIEWIEEHTEAMEIMTSEQGFEILGYNKGQIQADEISKELIDGLVELAIKIQEKNNE